MRLRPLLLSPAALLSLCLLVLALSTPASAQEGAQEGADLYAANCSACHGAEGAGIVGAFPPLAGHLPTLLAVEGGRAYLIGTLLYGLQGPLEIDGQTYNGVMPPWPQLDDAQLAAVLNHSATAWGNDAALPQTFTPFGADEVAAQRGLGLDGNAMLERRAQLTPGE